MKKFYKKAFHFLSIALALIITTLNASAALSKGDLAVIGMNSDADGGTTLRSFAVVALNTIPANEVIYITDRGWVNAYGSTAGHFVAVATTNEGTLQWQPSSTIPAGTVIIFKIDLATRTVSATKGDGTAFLNTDFSILSGTWSNATLSTNPWPPATGDQLIIYQGNEVSPSFIFAFNNIRLNTAVGTTSNGWNINPNSTEPTTQLPAYSELPSDLGTTYSTGFLTSTANSRYPNEKYNPTSSSGTKTAFLTDITNTANWINKTTSGSAYDFSLGFGANNVKQFNLGNSAAPTVTAAKINISGASGTGGAFKIGDVVTVTWDNTASGDNNSGITAVTVDFSQFGGGTTVTATNSSDIWTAIYTITAGTIDATSRNVSISATNANGSTTTADDANVTVDNQAPTVTDARISISGASGTGGVFKIGDVVTATWNNTAGGDNNSDVISTVTVNFSQFGGGNAVAAVNSSGTWTAVYTITAGNINRVTNRNVAVTATDNAGNSSTTADATNATVDNQVPATPVIVSPANGATIASLTPDYTGSSDGNILITVYVDNNAIGTTTSDASGIWTRSQSSALTFGSHTVKATATDAAGNVSPESAVNTFTIGGSPVVTTTGSTISFSGSAVAVDNGITVSDPDNSTLSSGRVSISGNFQSNQDVLNFLANSSTYGNITGSYNSSNGTLTLTSAGATATVPQWQAAFRSITYNNTASTPNTASRTISFIVNDGANDSNTASRVVTINPQTTITALVRASSNPTNAASVQYTATFNGSVTGLTTSNFSITTSGSLSGVSVTSITGSGNTYTITVNAGIGTGILTLNLANTTGISPAISNALPYAGQDYTIDTTRPSVVITSTAGASGSSTSNSPIPFTVTFSEAVTGFVAGDITPGNATISGFSGSGTTYTFNATPIANGAVTMNIAANVAQDAAGNGNTAASQFSITYAQANQAPIVTTTGGSNTFSGSQVVIDNGLTVADADNTTLSFATVGITGNFIAGEDILTYTNNSSALYGNITGSYNAGTGVLTLTSSGAIATVAQWQAALRSVAYNNTAGSPNTATRTISFTVNDGTANSNTATKNVTVINQATVTSIVRAASNPTNAAAVTYTVTFNKSVTGLSTTNFSITTSGTINGISPSVSGSGTTYTVTINTGTGSGTLRLNLANSTGISPSTITNLPFIGETYNIDKIAPSVTSVAVPANGTYTASQNLDFTVNFSEAVTVDATGGTPYIDVNLNTGGTVRANYISGSGTTALVYRYTVASTDRDLDGIVLGALNINGATIRDAAGNDVNTTLNNVGSTAGVLVDGTPSLPQTITFNTLPAKTYGDADFDPGATSDNPGIPISYTSSNTSVATIVNGKIQIIAVGTSTITASQTGDATHSAAANKQQTLTVNAKAITVTADAKTKNYGDADPALTYSITSGALVGTDTFTGSLSRLPGENVGTYAINQGTLALNGNYTLTYIGADLTIGAKTVTVTAAAKSKTYGDADPALTYTFAP
ncbi:beta strand repeat-containing protein, partial [Pedobacter sp. MR22-3]|uniref:beta strand repeat-containing protein n=1 Tax=Pedobacter sp. MR22-3 TaxID=2994552 RepID=UPI00224538EC